MAMRFHFSFLSDGLNAVSTPSKLLGRMFERAVDCRGHGCCQCGRDIQRCSSIIDQGEHTMLIPETKDSKNAKLR